MPVHDARRTRHLLDIEPLRLALVVLDARRIAAERDHEVALVVGARHSASQQDTGDEPREE
jgi:hypothetical protein